jgi:hypothetical protein
MFILNANFAICDQTYLLAQLQLNTSQYKIQQSLNANFTICHQTYLFAQLH